MSFEKDPENVRRVVDHGRNLEFRRMQSLPQGFATFVLSPLGNDTGGAPIIMHVDCSTSFAGGNTNIAVEWSSSWQIYNNRACERQSADQYQEATLRAIIEEGLICLHRRSKPHPRIEEHISITFK